MSRCPNCCYGGLWAPLPVPNGFETACEPRDPYDSRNCGFWHRYDATGETGWHLVRRITEGTGPMVGGGEL